MLFLQASPRANGNTGWMAEEYKGGIHNVDNIEGGHPVHQAFTPVPLLSTMTSATTGMQRTPAS